MSQGSWRSHSRAMAQWIDKEAPLHPLLRSFHFNLPGKPSTQNGSLPSLFFWQAPLGNPLPLQGARGFLWLSPTRLLLLVCLLPAAPRGDGEDRQPLSPGLFVELCVMANRPILITAVRIENSSQLQLKTEVLTLSYTNTRSYCIVREVLT